jgi:hypothetical protein
MTARPAALAALAAVLALGCLPAEAGEAVPAPGEIHWRLPAEMPVQEAGTSRGVGLLPLGMARVGETLYAAAVTGGRSAVLLARSGEGPWVEGTGIAQAQRVSRWVPLNGAAAVLVGARGGVQLVVLKPEAGPDERAVTHDVHAPDEKANANAAFGIRRIYYQVYGVDLAVHDGKLIAVYSLVDPTSGVRVPRLLLRISADGGKSWSEAVKLADSGAGRVPSICLALWSGGENLHLLQPDQENEGIVHRVSRDGGLTWKDAPDLPAPAEGKTIALARVFRDGKDVLLGVTESAKGGAVWLYSSADGGSTWAKPRRIGKVKAVAGTAGPLAACHLSAAGGAMVFGCGSLTAKQSYDRKTRTSKYSLITSGALLISRDAGTSWKPVAFARGLAGRNYAPRAELRPDGGMSVIFGWTDGKGSCLMLGREARPGPRPAADPAVRARVAKMVKDLADDDFRVREAAAAGLASMGMSVLPDLRKAAAGKDAERGLTAEDLLRKMTPAWWKGP